MTAAIDKGLWTLVLIATIAGISGCHEEDSLEQLQHWITQAKTNSQQADSALDPLPALPAEPDLFVSTYLIDSPTTPFGQETAVNLDERIDSAPQRPPQRGAPDLLEQFSLASLRMVGSFMREGQRQAVVAADGVLYPVHPGDYIGQQFGMVEHISENAIALQELVHDKNGNWIVRNAQLIMDGTRQ
jgi:type IV pilus assembly protein PilP